MSLTDVRPSWRALMVSLLVLTGALTVAASAGARAKLASTASSSEPAKINLLTYVGGTSGHASSKKAPITIGWMNNQGGPVGYPEGTAAFLAAVKYINVKLGGIQGHQLKVVTCFTATSDEQAQQCAQEMVNNKKIKLVAVGNMATGSSVMYQTIDNKKPIMGEGAATPQDEGQKAAWDWFVSTLGQDGMGTFLAKELHVKNVAILSPDGVFASLAPVYQGILKAAGVNSTIVTYPQDATDLTAPLIAAGVQNDQALLASVDEGSCVRVYQALKQLNIKIPVLTTALCMDPSVEAALGGSFPKGWSYGTSANAFDHQDPNIAKFLGLMRKYAPAKTPTGGLAPDSFGLAMLIGKFLNKVGPSHVTVSSIRKVADAFRGPVFLGPNYVKCGYVKTQPATCVISTAVDTSLGNGKWNTYGGKWFQ